MLWFLCEQRLFKRNADTHFADFSILWLNVSKEKIVPLIFFFFSRKLKEFIKAEEKDNVGKLKHLKIQEFVQAAVVVHSLRLLSRLQCDLRNA